MLNNPQDNSSVVDYQLANIVGRVACVDIAGSDVQMHPNAPGSIEFIDSLEIDEAKARGNLLFRLAEHTQVIVMADVVKHACEAAGLTGMRFLRPEDFSLWRTARRAPP